MHKNIDTTHRDVVCFLQNNDRNERRDGRMNSYCSFDFGRKDGTILTAEKFYAEHPNARVPPEEEKRMLSNLERMGLLVLQQFWERSITNIEGYYETIIFRNEETNELFFMPIEDVRVFFVKKRNRLIIYDIVVMQ